MPRTNMRISAILMMFAALLLVPTSLSGQVRLSFPQGAQAGADVEMRFAGRLPFVQVEIDGREAGWFLVDTGAWINSIDKAVVEKLKLQQIGESVVRGAGGEVRTPVVRVERFALADQLILENHQAVVLDLGPMQRAFGVEFAGILGGSVLRQLPFTMDFRRNRLQIHMPGQLTVPRQATEVDIELIDQIPAIAVKLENQDAHLAVDTGAGIPLMLFPHFVNEHQLATDGRTLTPMMTLGVGAAAEMYRSEVRQVHLPGRRVAAQEAWLRTEGRSPFSDERIAGILGAGAMADLRLSMDFRQGKAWFLWYPPRSAALQARQMVEAGIEQRDLGGNTPLVNAARFGDTELVRRLLAAGADIDKANDAGITPLQMALVSRRYEVAELLIARDADVDKPDAMDFSPLARAAQARDVVAIRLLLRAGANADKPLGDTTIRQVLQQLADPSIGELLGD